ncbi:MAG: glycosyltransferase family 39 protein [Phycisphaerales bacterium]|nr:glycosyltransferase family 39 protein [Phycisphaerales bacterium]
MQSPPATPLRQSLPLFLGPFLITATFLCLLYTTWNAWIAPLIDFGRELYVPWQLSQGAILYRDITSFYGPLSPLLHALCFHFFGASLLTLILANCLVLALATFFLHEIIRSISTRFTAAVVCIFFLAVFGFSRMVPTANFCFIAPYSHEATHGFTLSLAAIYCFIRYTRSPRRAWIAIIGLCTGLVFLTKPEIFLALAGFLLFAMIAEITSRLAPRSRSLLAASRPHPSATILPLLAISAILPLAAAVAYLAAHMPLSSAWHGTLGSWTFLSNSTVTGNRFFTNCMGLLDPFTHLTDIAKFSALFLLLIGPATLLSFFLPDGRLPRRAAGAALAIASVLLPWWLLPYWLGPHFSWIDLGTLLFVGSLALAICQSILLVHHRADPTRRAQLSLRLALSLFALLMLLKMFLYTSLYHYGFTLAVMATSLLAVSLLDWIPSTLEHHGKCGWTFRAAALTLLTALAIECATLSYKNLPDPHNLVGQALNQFRDNNAPIFQDMLHFMQTQIPSDRTLTVLPEGAILNFLAQRPSPVPFVTFLPSDIDMFSEPHLLASLQQHPPDYIAITHRPTGEFGPLAFGIDYASSLRNYIMTHYTPAHLSGIIPYTAYSPTTFGILLLRRNDLADRDDKVTR